MNLLYVGAPQRRRFMISLGEQMGNYVSFYAYEAEKAINMVRQQADGLVLVGLQKPIFSDRDEYDEMLYHAERMSIPIAAVLKPLNGSKRMAKLPGDNKGLGVVISSRRRSAKQIAKRLTYFFDRSFAQKSG